VGGILISVAKLVLTTLCAGIHPNRTLPVVLDCGTDSDELLNDDLYLGLKKPRVRGKEYDDFVDAFVQSARKLYPKAYIHFEDFGLLNGIYPLQSTPLVQILSWPQLTFPARRILDRYRPEIPCFNDDVQGTGCVTLAAIMAGLHISKLKLEDMRMVIFGAGTAGTGIADQVRDAIAADSGKSKDEAAKQIWYPCSPPHRSHFYPPPSDETRCVDKPGLLLKSHDKLTHAQIGYARDDSEWEGREGHDLLAVIKGVKPHVLIGTSTRTPISTLLPPQPN